MKPSELLTALLKLYSNPKRWAQGYYAYDRKHNHVSVFDASATCFCLIGGLQKVTPAKPATIEYIRVDARRYLERATPEYESLVFFNDKPGRKLKEVRDAIKAARKLALADGV